MDQKVNLDGRRHTLFTSTISGEQDGEVFLLGEPLTRFAEKHSFSYSVGSLLLGRKLQSAKTEQFIDSVLRTLVDHGPYQSGAVNTMVSARAGKDLVSSLVSGLLTIGPRFGGAINAAAANWFKNVNEKVRPEELVEAFSKKKAYVPGIGHRKYRVDMPDPRVKVLKELGTKVVSHVYLDFALGVEKCTTSKKPNLILNVDGTIAAVLLDLLSVEEQLSNITIQQLIDSEFFNALFVLSRSVGLVAHYLDQKRINEPLFRLEADQVFTKNINF